MWVAAVLGFGVGHDFLAVDEVFDDFAAADFDFEGDPLIAVEGFGFGVDAVGGFEFAVHLDVGSGGAEVSGGAFAGAGAAEELDFEGGWEVLFLFHGFGGFAVDHDAGVAEGPAGSFFDLVAGEAVFEA